MITFLMAVVTICLFVLALKFAGDYLAALLKWAWVGLCAIGAIYLCFLLIGFVWEYSGVFWKYVCTAVPYTVVVAVLCGAAIGLRNCFLEGYNKKSLAVKDGQ